MNPAGSRGRLSGDGLRALYEAQKAWFAPERNRLLRRAGLATAERILDLGCGYGGMLADLTRRARGPVVGVDRDGQALAGTSGLRVQALASRLPFRNASFDLVFAQMVFLWTGCDAGLLAEIRRVLRPGRFLVVAAEPDWRGAFSEPATAALAEFAEELRREGADPFVGGRLGPALEDAGFAVECGLHPVRPLAAPKETPGLVRGAESLRFLFVPYVYCLARKE
jgi:SAM-dependent methyltransferase